VVECTTQALSVDADHVKATLLRGGAHLALEHATLAIRDFTRVLSLDPENKEAKAELRCAQKMKSGGAIGNLGRERILVKLAETAKRQAVLQSEISSLARKLVKEKREVMQERETPTDAGSGRGTRSSLWADHEKENLSFIEAHKQILALGLPKHLLEDDGINDDAMREILLDYEEDEEVIAEAQQLLQPLGTGDPERARAIAMGTIVEIHQCMALEMKKILDGFLELSERKRSTFSKKERETTAELLVSIAVENRFAIPCEDVEQAVIMHEEELHANADYAQCTEQLSIMMQELTGAGQEVSDRQL